MNKKGFIGGFFSLFLFVIVLVSLIPIQERVMTKEEAINNLDWNNLTTHSELTKETNNSFSNIIFKVIDAAGYTAFETAKIGIEWGVDNLHIKATTILWLLMASLLAPILFSLIKLSIIVFIFIKDLIESKKEKKEIERLREDKLMEELK